MTSKNQDLRILSVLGIGRAKIFQLEFVLKVTSVSTRPVDSFRLIDTTVTPREMRESAKAVVTPQVDKSRAPRAAQHYFIAITCATN